MQIKKWDKRFIELAKFVSQWSKDPSTKVGAVIAKNNEFISLGFNGFAKGMNDSKKSYQNRQEKYLKIIHGEMNAILFSKKDLTGCTLYTYPFLPCSRCASVIIQVGIKRVISLKPSKEILARWDSELKLTKKMFKEAKIEFMECSNKG